MNTSRPLHLLILSLPLWLAACNDKGTIPPSPAATAATINGVRVIDAQTYQLGVSALDSTQAILSTAVLSRPSVTQLSSGQATAEVCGQIQQQDTLTTAITLDSTGSMANTDPGQLRRQAAQAFVDRMISADRAAVLSFDSHTPPTSGLMVAHLWQDFTVDRNALTVGIGQAIFEGGSTPLYDAMMDASTLVSRAAGNNRSVLLLTDGNDNASATNPDQVIAAAKAAGTRVFAVGLDQSNTLDFQELERIASETGGLFQKASDAAQLTSYFDHVYNAVSAQGCLQLNFSVQPAAGSTVTGDLTFTVSASGKADAQLRVPFSFTAR